MPRLTPTAKTTRPLALALILAAVLAAPPTLAAPRTSPERAASTTSTATPDSGKASVTWTRLFSGGPLLTVTATATDRAGNVYVAGRGADATLTFERQRPNGFRTVPNGPTDLWVAKLAPDGALRWLTFLGATERPDEAQGDFLGGIAVTPDGGLAFAASAYGADFDGASGPGYAGGWDAVVGTLSPDGTTVRARYLPGTAGNEWGTAIAAAPSGDLAVAGEVGDSKAGERMPATPGAYAAPPEAGTVVFAARLTRELRPRWVATLGADGAGLLGIRGAGIDAAGAVYVGAATWHHDLPVTPGAVEPVKPDGANGGYAAKLAPDGRRIVWATYAAPDSTISGMTFGSDGSTYVTGTRLDDTAFPRVRPAQRTCPPATGVIRNMYAQRIAPGGTAYAWSTCIGGAGDDGTNVRPALDSAGTFWLAGFTSSATDFPQVRPTQPFAGLAAPEPLEQYDGAVVGIGSDGRYRLATFLGGHDFLREEGYAVAPLPNGVAVAGITDADDFPGAAASAERPVLPGGRVYGFVTRLAA